MPLVTPFEGDSEALAVDRLRSNLAKWNSTPLHGYVVMGSNGEFPLLGMEEKRRLLEVVAAEGTKASKLLIAGTGSCGTRETIELTKSAASMVCFELYQLRVSLTGATLSRVTTLQWS